MNNKSRRNWFVTSFGRSVSFKQCSENVKKYCNYCSPIHNMKTWIECLIRLFLDMNKSGFWRDHFYIIRVANKLLGKMVSCMLLFKLLKLFSATI